MSSHVRGLGSIFAALLALALPLSCSGDDTGPGPGPATIAVAGVTLTPGDMSLALGGEVGRLTAAIAPPDATNQGVTWTSEDTSVAVVVGNGLGATVTAAAIGATTITVKTNDGEKTASCTVRVTEGTGVTLDKPTMSLIVGRRGTLTATIAPAGATGKDVTWTSSNTAVASIDGTGATVVINGLTVGEATITAALVADPTKAATCAVMVHLPVGAPDILVAGDFGLYVNGQYDHSIDGQDLTDVHVDDQGSVHAVGWYEDTVGAIRWNAAYYRGGVCTVLPTTAPGVTESVAQSVWAAGASVYIAGCETTDNGDVARLWKDGAQSPLEGVDDTGAIESAAYRVCAFNNDVYVAGGMVGEDGDTHPVIWKNGARHMFAGINGILTDMGIASDGAIYALGYSYSEWRRYEYAIPPGLATMDLVELSGDNSQYPLRMFVDGMDVYVAGYHGDEACYWKNGVQHDIEHPAIAVWVEADAIHVFGGHIYIAGCSRRAAGYYTELWIDGSYISDERAIADRMNGSEAMAAAIAVQHIDRTAVAGVTLSDAALSIPVGYTGTLTATVAPADATDKRLAWTSSDPAVATVTGAGATVVVNALAVGAANIAVRTLDGDHVATCAVTVQAVAVTGVSLSAASLTVGVNRAAPLTAVIAPPNATNKNIDWTSSNAGVAAASGAGQAGAVLGVSPGVATITATTQDGHFAATCEVTVVEAADPAAYIAGHFGLYIDGIRDTGVGSQAGEAGLRAVSVDSAGNVHAAGYLRSPLGSNGYVAAHYKNGNATILPMTHASDLIESGAHDMFLSGDDVYVAGYEGFTRIDGGVGIVARLWKSSNGGADFAQVPLQGVDETGVMFTRAYTVCVHGGDTYVAGYDWPDDSGNSMFPAFWVNGAKTVKNNSANYGQYGVIDMGLTADGAMYVVGSNVYWGDEYDNAVFRIDPANLMAWTYIVGSWDDGNNYPMHIFVEGADVYSTGYHEPSGEPTGPCYWTNGARTDLEAPAGVMYADGYDIHILDGRIYVAGAAAYSGGDAANYSRIVQWIDGAIVTGPGAIQDTYEYLAAPQALFVQK